MSKTPQERPKQTFLSNFLRFTHINKSAKQQTVQLEVFYENLNLATGFQMFLTLQGGKIFKKRPKLVYNSIFNGINCKCSSQKDVHTAVFNGINCKCSSQKDVDPVEFCQINILTRGLGLHPHIASKMVERAFLRFCLSLM